MWVVLAVFLAGDIALGAAAWRHVQTDPSVSPSLDAGSGPEPVAVGPNDTPAAVQFDPVEPASATMLDAADDGTLIAATAGSCNGSAPIVRVSRDRGATLMSVTPEAQRVLAVDARLGGELSLVVADENCEVSALISEDAGQSWDSTDIGQIWYRDPQSTSHVYSGETRSDVGCPVIALSGINVQAARATCADGSVRSTDSTGRRWARVPVLRGASAIGFASATSGTALVKSADCGAAAFVTTNGGQSWQERGCAGDALAAALLDQGSLVYALVGDEVRVSGDGAKTWIAAEDTAAIDPSADPTTTSDPPAEESAAPDEDEERE